MRRATLTAAVLLAACAGRPAPPATPATPASTPEPARAPTAEPAPPELRLPRDARPLRYDLELTIDPRQERFQGVIHIDLELARSSSFLWLHATDLEITRATLAAGGAEVPARVVPAPPDFAGFAFAREIAAGPARLTIAYQGTLDSTRSRGVYRVAEPDGEQYAYTFFEPIDARRAFPCFDEPEYKVPWKLTLRVPAAHVALANAPVASERVEGDTRIVAIEESKPLPSYLVAFVVGPFEVVDAGTAGGHGTPLRFVVPRGRARELRYAREVTTRFVTLLEDYFGMPYPYGKLDVAVVPRFWGTMEHPGLVAMGQPLTLIDPDDASLGRKQRYVNIGIHELAHYWFGDYVTMRWWDDTWLNEAFGTWLDRKLTHRFDPSWRHDLSGLMQTDYGMAGDALATAHPIRIAVEKRSDIQSSFDNQITYFKGAGVIEMFEGWIGEELFQRAIRRYMEKFAWGTATDDDLLATLDEVTGKDVSGALRTFLDGPGVPLVRAGVACEAGKPPRLLLTQERFLSRGSAEGRWKIPVCARWGAGKRTGRACTLLAEARDELPLEGACPEWITANAGAVGYYRVEYEPALRERLGQRLARLDLRERIGYVKDLVALVAPGRVPIAETFAILPGLLAPRADAREVLLAARIVGQIRPGELDDEDVPRIYSVITRLFGARARALGWSPRKGEAPEQEELRRAIVPLVSFAGDTRLTTEARRLAESWLADPRALPDDAVDGVLAVAARAGDAAFFERVLAAAPKADRRARARLLVALGSFRQPELATRALELVLDKRFDLRDSLGILVAVLGTRETRQLAYDFIKAHFEELRARMRDDEASFLLAAPGKFCDAAHRDDAAAWFGPRATPIDGGERTLARTLEAIDVCIEARARNAPAIKAFLARR